VNVGTIFTELVLDSSKYQTGLKNIQQQSVTSGKVMEDALGHGPATAMNLLHTKLRTLAGITAAAFSTHAIYAYAKEATMLTARLETMSVVLGIIGKNAGYSAGSMKDYVEQVKKMGITTSAAQDSITKMAQANLDLSKASQLARVAQDAAVIGNINSSEAFQHMVYAIKTAQPEMLRTVGINVSFESSYAKFAATLNKSAGSLTENEKGQARLNAVLQEGEKIQGSYEAAMQTTAKLINSLPRYFEEVKEKVGELFSPALGVAVRALTEGLKDLGKIMDDLSKSGELALWAKRFSDALGVSLKATATFAGWIIDLTKEILKLKEVIVEISIVTGFVVLAGALTGIIALSGPFIVAAAAIATSIAAIATSIAGIGTALAVVNPVYAAFVLAGLALTGAWMAWKEAIKGTNKAIFDAEDEMTKFNAKLEKMKFKTVDKDFNVQLKKEIEEFAKTLNTTPDKISPKLQKDIAKRLEGFYEAPKLIEKFQKRIAEINQTDTTKFGFDASEKMQALKAEKETLALFISQLEFKQRMAKANEDEAAAQKKINEENMQKEKETRVKAKVEAQAHEALIQSKRIQDERYFLERQKNFDDGIRIARESSVSETEIADKVKNEKINVSEETFDKTMAIEKLIAKEKKRLDEYGFKDHVYIESKRLDASLKMYKTQEEARKEHEKKIESLGIDTLEKQLGYDKQAIDKITVLEDAQFAHRQRLSELAGENEMDMIDSERQYKEQSLRSWYYNQKEFAQREIEISRLKSIASGNEFDEKKELQEKLGTIESERQVRVIKNLDEINEKTRAANEKSLRSYKDYYTTMASSAGISYEEAKYYAGMAQTYELSLLASTKAQMLAAGMTEDDWQKWFNLKAIESTKAMVDELIAKDTKLLNIMREYYETFSGDVSNLIALETARNKLSIDNMNYELEMLKEIYDDEKAKEIMSIILAERNHQSKKNILINQANQYKSTYEKIKGFEKQRYEWSLKQINLEAAEIKKLTESEDAAEKYKVQKSREAYIQMARDSQSFFAGINAGIMENANLVNTWGNVGYDVVQTFTRDATGILSDKFFKIVKGDFENLWTIDWTGMLDNMLRILTQKIAKMIVQWALLKAEIMAINAINVISPGLIPNILPGMAPGLIPTATAGAPYILPGMAPGVLPAVLPGAATAAPYILPTAETVTTATTATTAATTAGATSALPVIGAIVATKLITDYIFENFIWSKSPGKTAQQLAAEAGKEAIWKVLSDINNWLAAIPPDYINSGNYDEDSGRWYFFTSHPEAYGYYLNTGISPGDVEAEQQRFDTYKTAYKDLWGKEWPQAKMGIDRIPMDNFPVMTHKDEAILTKNEAQQWRDGTSRPLHIHIEMNGREIGYVIADETETNPRLQKAIRRLAA